MTRPRLSTDPDDRRSAVSCTCELPGVEAVLFDYGGVLTGPVRDSIAQWLAGDGVEPGSFSRTLRAWLSRDAIEGTPIHLLEIGELPVEKFEVLLATELVTTHGRPVAAEGLLRRIFGGLQEDESMFALVDELKMRGIRVGMVSNSWGNTYPRERIDRSFDVVAISGEVGLRKPHAEIYQLALDNLGVIAERALFIDDAQPNLEGAQRVGMRTLLHEDSSATRRAVAGLAPQCPHQGRTGR